MLIFTFYFDCLLIIIIIIVKLGTLTWAGHVSCMGEIINSCKILVEDSQGKYTNCETLKQMGLQH